MSWAGMLIIAGGTLLVACICVAGAVRVKIRYAPVLILAEIITLAWGSWRWLRACHLPWLRVAAFMWGRRESPEPVACHRCGWGGFTRWLIHGYEDDGVGDVCAVCYCPKCNQEVW